MDHGHLHWDDSKYYQKRLFGIDHQQHEEKSWLLSVHSSKPWKDCGYQKRSESAIFQGDSH